MIPGEYIPATEPVDVNAGLPVTRVAISNTGDVPVHLTSHFHVFEANPRLRFDRRKAFGMRLETHAKGSVRFSPGETREVELIPIGGQRVVFGFSGVINGSLDTTNIEEALEQLRVRGFLHEDAQ